jgi:hypothetical protein
MYSAGSGSVVRDSAGDLSLFVSELLDEMRAPGVPADEVFNHTRIGVLRASQGEQMPSNYSSLNEEFTFGQPVDQARREAGNAIGTKRRGSPTEAGRRRAS